MWKSHRHRLETLLVAFGLAVYVKGFAGNDGTGSLVRPRAGGVNDRRLHLWDGSCLCRRRLGRPFSLLLMSDQDLDGDLTSPDSQPPRDAKSTSGRLGGRSKRTLQRQSSPPKLPGPVGLASLGLLLLALWLSSKLFSLSAPSYVFYESRLYESRTYGADGRVETSRRQSVRSNVPSLMKDIKQSQRVLPESTDRMEEQLNRDIQDMLRIEDRWFD